MSLRFSGAHKIGLEAGGETTPEMFLEAQEGVWLLAIVS